MEAAERDSNPERTIDNVVSAEAPASPAAPAVVAGDSAPASIFPDEWPGTPLEDGGRGSQPWTPSSRATRQVSEVLCERIDGEDESLTRYRQSLLGDAADIDAAASFVPTSDIPVVSLEAIIVRFDHPSLPPVVVNGLADPDVAASRLASLASRELLAPEGVPHSISFAFRVRGLIVSRLVWRHSVRKAKLPVFAVSDVVGSFAPRAAPYIWTSEWIATPSGAIARMSSAVGTHSFVDADGGRYSTLQYKLRIRSLNGFPTARQFADLCSDKDSEMYLEAVRRQCGEQLSLQYSHERSAVCSGKFQVDDRVARTSVRSRPSAEPSADGQS